MKGAPSSFPVAESPCNRTVVWVAATCVACVRTSFQAADWPTMCSRPTDVRSTLSLIDRTRCKEPGMSTSTGSSQRSASIKGLCNTSIAYAIHDPQRCLYGPCVVSVLRGGRVSLRRRRCQHLRTLPDGRHAPDSTRRRPRWQCGAQVSALNRREHEKSGRVSRPAIAPVSLLTQNGPPVAVPFGVRGHGQGFGQKIGEANERLKGTLLSRRAARPHGNHQDQVNADLLAFIKSSRYGTTSNRQNRRRGRRVTAFRQ